MLRSLSLRLIRREPKTPRTVARRPSRPARPAVEYLEDRSVPATTAVDFSPVQTYATGSQQSRSIAVADFNGDGHEDMAVVNSYPNPSTSVFLGNGAGQFQLLQTFQIGFDSPYSVAVGDFNGDGKSDLVVVNWTGDNNVKVLLSDGTGHFTPGGTFASGGGGATSVAVADFNGDGRDDVAVTNEFANSANQGEDTVGVLLGNGAGGFAPALTYPTGGGDPVSVAVGDFNGDGRPDLAVANSGYPFGTLGRGVGVLLNNGTGGFAPAVNYTTGGEAAGVAVGDFNGDGHDDLAVTNSNTGTVAVLLGNGTGGFAAAVQYATGGTPVSVAVADFNGDGNADLAVANDGAHTVAVLPGDGVGGFGAAQTFPTGGNATFVAVGDFNSDGRPDLAVANFEGTVGVLLNQTLPTQTQGLIEIIRGLIENHELDRGRGRALTATLQAALRQVQRGNTTAAVNQIEAFINKVEALVRAGALDQSVAQVLIAGANAVIARISA